MIKNETLSQGAIREVQEETGIGNLTVKKYLKKTFHIYKLQDQYILKVTHWFELQCHQITKSIPQLEEDITKVKWIPIKKLPKVLKKSYANIQSLFPYYIGEF